MKREQVFRARILLALSLGVIMALSLCLAKLSTGSAMNYQEKGGRTKATSTPAPMATPRPTSGQPARSTPRTPPRNVQRSTPSKQTAPEVEVVLIPAGTFMMGLPEEIKMMFTDNEHPQHQVTVQSFYIGKYEVTQAQYRAVMGTNPSYFKGDNLPVDNVSWNNAVEFCRKLSQMTGKEYRLPSEAEWEYACRAGTTTEFAFGDSLSSDQANFNGMWPFGGAAKGVVRNKTTPVGSFRPNVWGLYDMHGNVREWCEDWYHDSYNGAPTDGSAWLSGGERKGRVLRGGAWHLAAEFLRSGSRALDKPAFHEQTLGFRVVAVARNR